MFSGSKGYHIHCRDFEVTDWTHYDAKNPLKSHEVARRRFIEAVKETCPKAFDSSHYVLSCEVTRVISFPESLNGETGLTCSYLGGPRDFERLTVDAIMIKAKKSIKPSKIIMFTLPFTSRPPGEALNTCTPYA